MGADWILLFVYVGGALSISFLCSILEATLLSSRAAELTQRKASGDRGAGILLELKQDRIDDAISAILTLNTIAHTIGATLAGAQFARITQDRWLGIFSGVLTLLVLVLTEIIPKTLGTVYASRLAGFVGRTISLLTRALAPILLITRALTRLVSHGHSTAISRGELTALVAMAHSEGELEGHEHQVLKNVLSFDSIKVEDVMTPRTVAVMVREESTLKELLDEPRAAHFSRIPVYKGNRDHVTGYVLLREALVESVRGCDLDVPVSRFQRELISIPDKTPLPQALRTFLERREHLAMAVDEFGGTSGLLTLEDVVETILGVEIMDESDRVGDLRQLAMQVRDRRIEHRRVREADSTSRTPSPAVTPEPVSEPEGAPAGKADAGGGA